MSDIKAIIESGNLDNIMDNLLNDSEQLIRNKGSYDVELQESFKQLIDKINKLDLPVHTDNKDNSDLLDAITEFSATHDVIYFKLGVMIGSNFERDLKRGYEELLRTDVHEE